jgi:hypothetical protein
MLSTNYWLSLPSDLRRSLACTKIIESMNSALAKGAGK